MIANNPCILRTLICACLGISRSTSYYKHTLPHKDKPWLDRIVRVLIRNPDYGIYRLKLHFDLEGDRVSQARIRRICRSNGISPKPQKRKPPVRDRNAPYTGVANLIDGITPSGPDHIWCGDFGN